MESSDKKTLTSAFAPEQIVYLLETGGRFECDPQAEGFEFAEKKQWVRRFYYPIMTGSIRSVGDHTEVVLSFSRSKLYRITMVVILSLFLTLAVVLGIISSDILVAAALLSFGCITNSVFYFGYAYHCRKATRRITKLISG